MIRAQSIDRLNYLCTPDGVRTFLVLDKWYGNNPQYELLELYKTVSIRRPVAEIDDLVAKGDLRVLKD